MVEFFIGFYLIQYRLLARNGPLVLHINNKFYKILLHEMQIYLEVFPQQSVDLFQEFVAANNMRNQRILFAIHEKDRFKWFLKRRHYFQSRVQCSIPYCPHHPKGLFVPVKFPGRLGRTVFLCEASHAHCDGCYYKLKSSWISYISNTAVRKKKCVLCRKILNCVRIRQTHPYNLRSVTKLKNNPTIALYDEYNSNHKLV